MNSGIEIILARMDTHPDEFMFGNDKWKFIYSDYFRDSLSEGEKGAIHDRLKQLRLEEFNQRVLQTLVPLEEPDGEEWTDIKTTLKATDAQIAKKLGMSMTEYAKKKVSLGL
jgi:hypothetical protein